MEIALHLGAHLTDEGLLDKCLRKNRSELADAGIVVKRTSNYLNLMRGAANDLANGNDTPDFMAKLLEALNAPEDSRRLVFSAPGLMTQLSQVTDGTILYPGAMARIACYRHLLAGTDAEIFIAFRNPASFIPALLQHVLDFERAEILENLRPEELRWSLYIDEIRQGWPEASVTVWCDEDTPFIWHRLLRLVSNYEPETEFKNSFNWFDSVMLKGGAAKLAAYLEANPPVDEAHRQQVISAFLDKYCDPAKLDVDVSIAGWDEARTDVISELYEEDTAKIRQMEGVKFISP